MEVVFLIAITALPLFWLFILRKYSGSKLNPPPGPRGLPLIGNMHQFASVDTHIYLQQLAKKYGPLVSLKLGSVPLLAISSASAAREVFKHHDLCFSNRPDSVSGHKLSYGNLGFIFSPYNDYWRSMKKFTNLHLFSSKRSRVFQPIREEEVARMVKTIRDQASTGPKILNLSKTLVAFTGSLTFRINFGKTYDDEAMSINFHRLLNQSQALFVTFFAADYFPLIGPLIDRLSGTWGRLDKSFNEIDAFYQERIDKYLPASSLSTDDYSMLDILTQMKKDSSDFTFDHMKAILMNVLIASTDTSAAAAVWTMTLLIKNPASMKKVQQEVRDLVGKKGFVDGNDVQKLVYLRAVLKEAMRLHPAAPILHRETIEKCVVSGYDIEAKTSVFLNAYAIGRDPECWDNPDEFIPERFINNSIDFLGHDFELIPFGLGRRVCPGIAMGVATTEQAIANLLYSFNWELPPGINKEDIDMATIPGLTVHKKNHLCLVPKIIDEVSQV